MRFIRAGLNSRFFIWAVLCLPSFPILGALLGGGSHATADALHESGEFSARLMVIAMMMSPLVLLAPRWRFFRWLLDRRRYFGVAAFAYAAVHLVIYLVDIASLREVWGQFFTLSILAGWLGLFLFLPLALTSNDWAVRLLGRRWRVLHRLVYAAAVAVLVHWALVGDEAAGAFVQYVPLVLLEGYRVWRAFVRPRPVAAVA